jgi:phosphoglycolate phosphatase-like HAD superfamily hydrolase
MSTATGNPRSASTVEHIVWDWNGTIFGDSIALIEATIDAFRECGMSPVTRADYQRHHTQPIPTFYEHLAGRALTDDEQQRLDRAFRSAYARHRATATLTVDAIAALTRWSATGGRQSLLSMYPHDELVMLVDLAGIADFFVRIDGSTGRDVARKAPHLARHLRRQGLTPARTLLVGDSVDDALAARECGVHCVIYHPGADALHTRDHFADLGVPLVATLEEAVEHAAPSARWTQCPTRP